VPEDDFSDFDPPPVEVDPPEIDVNDPDNDQGRDQDTGDYDVPAPDLFDNDDDAD
jgi:hypothetical protein